MGHTSVHRNYLQQQQQQWRRQKHKQQQTQPEGGVKGLGSLVERGRVVQPDAVVGQGSAPFKQMKLKCCWRTVWLAGLLGRGRRKHQCTAQQNRRRHMSECGE
jgi:hypothetical protein